MTHSTDRSIENFVIKPLSTTTWDGVAFNTPAIDVDWIADGGAPCDPEKVKLLAQSYTVTGPRMPPAVSAARPKTDRSSEECAREWRRELRAEPKRRRGRR